jgi:hypothetical protein
MINPFSRESLDYADDYATSVPRGVAILFLLSFRDAVKLHEDDPKATVFASADDYLAQKKGPVVTMEHVNAVIAKVKKMKTFYFYF